MMASFVQDCQRDAIDPQNRIQGQSTVNVDVTPSENGNGLGVDDSKLQLQPKLEIWKRPGEISNQIMEKEDAAPSK
jgi:hypothetical protein